MIDVAGHHKAVKQHRRSIKRGWRDEDSGEYADVVGAEAASATKGALAAIGNRSGASAK